MLYRKFEKRIEEFLQKEPNKILLVNGARQIGKSYLIRYVGKRMFKNYVEINLKEDKESLGVFATVKSTSDFYMQLGAIAGNRLGIKENTTKNEIMSTFVNRFGPKIMPVSTLENINQ